MVGGRLAVQRRLLRPLAAAAHDHGRAAAAVVRSPAPGIRLSALFRLVAGQGGAVVPSLPPRLVAAPSCRSGALPDLAGAGDSLVQEPAFLSRQDPPGPAPPGRPHPYRSPGGAAGGSKEHGASSAGPPDYRRASASVATAGDRPARALKSVVGCHLGNERGTALPGALGQEGRKARLRPNGLL